MSIKLSFKRIARESAADFFAPLTVLYQLLATDLSTASLGEQPRRAATFRQGPTPKRSSRLADGQSPDASRDLESASEDGSAPSGRASGPVV